MTTMIKDKNGAWVPDTSTSTLGSLAPKTGFDSNIFAQKVADMLTGLQATQKEGSANLAGAANTLTTESIGAAGAYNPQATPDVNIQNIKAMPAAFTPAITSINTQLENANKAAEFTQGNINIVKDLYKPQPVPEGTTLVTPEGDVVYQGKSYTPQINLNTGVQDSYNSATGQWLSDVKKTTKSTSSSNGTVGGMNVGAYNGGIDPSYVQELNTSYQSIEKAVPTPSAPAYDAYITSHTGGKKAPVTGQMIMNASATYGVDPSVFAALLGHETSFGSAGEAPKNNNPGGILYVGQAGATQGSPRPASEGGYYAAYSSWEKGVNAAAQLLASKNTQAPKTDPTLSPIGGQFSSSASARIKQLPEPYQKYVDAGPQGVAYINSTKMPDGPIKDALKIQASKAGIQFLDPADVAVMQSINSVAQSMASMKELVDNNLKSGLYGRINDATKYFVNRLFQNDTEFTKFDTYRSAAIKAVSALAGGSGSGLRINGAEIATQIENLPQSSDNLETAKALLSQMNLFIAQKLKNTFPDIDISKGIINAQTGSPTTGGSDINSLKNKYQITY